MVYVPGTATTDQKKQNRSLQVLNATQTSNAANIATNTTNIATNTTAIAAINAALPPASSPIHASLAADVLLNNTANFFDGPSVAQGTTGTWFASGTVSLIDTAGAASMICKLWDGTTVIASATPAVTAANVRFTASLSGVMTSPAGNIRISVQDVTSTSGKITFNASGTSKDSTITAFRIA